jgi:phytanoyl-CoA hydroxylase
VQMDPSDSRGLAESFHRDGYVLVRGVFEPAELTALAEHVFHLRQPSQSERDRYGVDGYELFGKDSLDQLTGAELLRCERLLRLHLFDAQTRQLMLDARLLSIVRALWPGDPLAVHALYFPKPPGGRGMALHADTGYLPTDPPELVGCFIAVDDADTENGALAVVRGSHDLPCNERRTIPTTDFIFPEEFIQPPDTELVVMSMRAGDVLVFHGKSLHSSMPNRTRDRWRRAFICHYVSAAVHVVSEELNPAFRATGEEIPAPGHSSIKRGGDAPHPAASGAALESVGKSQTSARG